MESLSIRSMPKMLQRERKIEIKREIKRKAEREEEEEIYIHVSAARGRTTLIYLFTSPNDKLIHRFINPSINPPTTHRNHELPHPHSNSSLHNSRVMRCTHPNSSSSSSYSPSSSSPHTHHQHQSHNLLITYSLTPKPKIFNNRNAWPSPEESAMEVELVTAELQKVESVRLVER